MLIDNLIARLVGFISIAGAVAFLLAIVGNQGVFIIWGLSFLQLATPGDVVMSGFEVLVRLMPTLTAFAIGVWLAPRISWPWSTKCGSCVGMGRMPT